QAARSMSSVAGPTVHSVSLEQCGRHLDAEVQAMHAWLLALGEAVLHSHAVPSLPTADAAAGQRLRGCVRHAVAANGQATLDLLWAGKHLGILRHIQEPLLRAANAESSVHRSNPAVEVAAGRHELITATSVQIKTLGFSSLGLGQPAARERSRS